MDFQVTAPNILLFPRRPLNIVSLSGGKDSSALLLMMLERGIPVDRIIFADVGPGAEFSEMYGYLRRLERYTGRKVTTIGSGRYTAISLFYGNFTRGKRVGTMRGFPPTIGPGCSFRRELKVIPLSKASGRGNNVFIGIAADEAHRCNSLEYAKGDNQYFFPLVDWGVTEQDCLNYLKSKGLYNSLYDYFRRMGCYWCPKQSIASLRSLWRYFPYYWEHLRQLELDCGRDFRYLSSVLLLEARFQRELEEKPEIFRAA
jgi:3'-phosphoadenosine 5'-phosphosulfate sulfotransferase (PAPS reductase)/FAD synthetase